MSRSLFFLHPKIAVRPFRKLRRLWIAAIAIPVALGALAGTLAAKTSRPQGAPPQPAQIFLSDLSQVFDGQPKAPTATTDPPNLNVVFTFNGSSSAPTNAGDYALVATVDDSSYYGSASATFTITQVDQSITFDPLPDRTFGDGPFTVSAAASSGLPVVFSIASGPATITNDGTVTLTGPGVVTVRAEQGGDNNYAAASPAEQSFTVASAPSGVSVSSSVNPTTFGDTTVFTANVTASSFYDGNPPQPSGTVQFKVDGENLGGPEALDANGNASMVSAASLSVGIHSVTADYSGDANFAAASGELPGGQTVNPSSNADLSALTLSDGQLSPDFVSYQTDYTANVPNETASVTVTPTTANGSATVTVNGQPVASGNASSPISLTLGSNTISVVITAQDGGTQRTYAITVTRAYKSNADLAALALSDAALSPDFTPENTSYTASVGHDVTSITVTPTVADTGSASRPNSTASVKKGGPAPAAANRSQAAPTNRSARSPGLSVISLGGATVTVNGAPVTSGTPSAPIALSVGDNPITIVVTADDGVTTKTYSVIVTRAPSTNADLASLTLSDGTLMPDFAPDVTDYTAGVAYSVNTVTVTPTLADTEGAGAFVTVNGAFVASGTPSEPITLNVGDNPIAVQVTAADGTTQKTYTVNVGRAGTPEISVFQAPGNDEIPDGGSANLQAVPVGGEAVLTFTIKNTGSADLTGLELSINGTDAGMFNVLSYPTAPVSGPSGSTTFTVRFAPTSAGLKTAALHIANNDLDEGPFDLALIGYGGAAVTYSGQGVNSIVLPTRVSSQTIAVQARGGDGGYAHPGSGVRPGGGGATLIGRFTTAGGDTLTLLIGARGGDAANDSRSGGGGGGGTGVVRNGSDVLIAAGGGGGTSRAAAGGGGRANPDSLPAGGAALGPTGGAGGGGGGFNAPGANSAGGAGGGGAGTLTSLGNGGAARNSGGIRPGAGGAGFGGGGGGEGQGAGGGGGYRGGDGAPSSGFDGGHAEGGDSFVALGVAAGSVLALNPGFDGRGSRRDGAVIVAFTPGAPDVTTGGASVFGPSATVRGSVNAGGANATISVEYGPTEGYGSTATPSPATASGLAATPVQAAIPGLTPGAVYHYRVVATNSEGTTFGADATFTAGAALAAVAEQAFLHPATPRSGLRYGSAVAVSGNTAVIGAPGDNSGATGVNGNELDTSAPSSGAAYVLVRDNAGQWTQQAYLKAGNTGAYDGFGGAVAISGDTIVVGARSEESNATGVNGDGANNNASSSGAAYVFVRTAGGTTWTQQAYLKAGNTEAYDNFGTAVAISGDTVAVGAPNESSNATGVNGDASNNAARGAGAVYVFARTGGTTWSQQAYVKAGNTGASDNFGRTLALSGDSLLVGAPYEASNATGVNGDGANNNAPYSGAAYVFVRTGGTTWTQQAYLKASNTDSGDVFGTSCAIDGDTAVVGAPEEAGNATGVNGDGANNNAPSSGAAYVFVRDAGTGLWTQSAYLKAPNTGAGDSFGQSVALAGNAILVGASQEASSATGINGDGSKDDAGGSGAAYLFLRDVGVTTGWTPQSYLKAGHTISYAYFGQAVALSGNTLVVGAPSDSTVASNGGAAYVFTFVPPAGPAAPAIAIEGPGGVALTDETDSVNFGNVPLGSSGAPKTFTITNAGTATLTLGAITTDGASAADFVVDATDLSTTLAPGETTTFRVTFTPGAASVRDAALHIASNDASRSPFDVALTGRGLSLSQIWRQGYFGTFDDSGDAANLADPDSDSVANLLEFAFGTHPKSGRLGPILVSDLTGALKGPVTSVNGQTITPGSPTTLVVTDPNTGSQSFFALFGRRKDYAAAGLSYKVQFTTDFVTWTDNVDTPTVLADDGTLQAVTVPYPALATPPPDEPSTQAFRVVVSIQ